MLHVKEVKYVSGKKIWVSFDDGTAGEVNLDGKLSGPVFDALREDEQFSKAYLDEESETVAWPNGADLAPEFLKDLLLSQSSQRMQG